MTMSTPTPTLPFNTLPGMPPAAAAPVSAESSMTSKDMGSPISIMGVPFDNVSKTQTLALIRRMVESRSPHYIATANVDFLVRAQTDADLRRILLDAHLVLCDGTPLVWASRLLGNPLPERVAGSDIVPLMLGLAAERGYRVFLLGAAEEVNRKAAENIQKEHPNLVIAGRYSPPAAPLEEMNNSEIRRQIRAARPDIVLVAFGCPKQEKWISMNYRDLGVPVCVGVGATIDFLAGAVRRAPLWMQQRGLEWTWRMLMEPRRLSARYAKGMFVFGRGMLRQLWSTTSAPSEGPCEPAWSMPCEHDTQMIVLPARLDAAAVDESRASWEMRLIGSRLIVDLSATVFADSTGIGFLIRLRRMAREAGVKFALANVAPSIRRTIELMKLGSAFPMGASVEEAIARVA